MYNCSNNEIGDNCFLCNKKLCEKCCPRVSEDENYCKTVFPLCSQCVKPRLENRVIKNNSKDATVSFEDDDFMYTPPPPPPPPPEEEDDSEEDQ